MFSFDSVVLFSFLSVFELIQSNQTFDFKFSGVNIITINHSFGNEWTKFGRTIKAVWIKLASDTSAT